MSRRKMLQIRAACHAAERFERHGIDTRTASQFV